MQNSSNQGGRKDSLPRGKRARTAEGFLTEIVETSEEWTALLKLKYQNRPQPRIPSLTKLSFRSRGETKMCSGEGGLRGSLPARQLWKDVLYMEEHRRLGTSGRRNLGKGKYGDHAASEPQATQQESSYSETVCWAEGRKGEPQRRSRTPAVCAMYPPPENGPHLSKERLSWVGLA